jgi:TolB protein
MSPRRIAVVGGVLTGIALGAALPAVAGAQGTFPRTTFLLSRSAAGGFPDGPSRNPAVSHDQRIARLMAYESDATNITTGDTNGQTDVFVVQRAQPWGDNGTPWTIGPTTIASVGTNGEPANGPSSLPSLDGDAHHNPHCVAFISSASNLVADDTNGVADAFVRDLTTNITQRVSVNSNGEQANGPTTEVSLDGACERVAFTSSATNLALTSTKRLSWRSAQTAQAAGSRQVYVRVINATAADATFKGLTFLASASAKGAAANAEAYEPSFAGAGKAVVFTSRASNLTARDGNGNTDVFERTFVRKYAHVGRGKGVQAFKFNTKLVSANGAGAAGNGASSHPDVSDDGNFVAFETTASDILPGDSNGTSDVVEMDLGGQLRRNLPYSCTMVSGGRDVCWVSRSKATSIGNGASNDPSISGAGEFVLFDSDATNLRESQSVKEDSNGLRDMFLWNRPTGNVSLESRAAPAAEGQKGDYLNVASQAPATSSRGNYVGFVSKGTSIDVPLVVNLGGVTPDPVNDLVYVRYLGEK